MDQASQPAPGYEPFQPVPKTDSPPPAELSRPRFWDRVLLGVGSLVVVVGVFGGFMPMMRQKFAILWPGHSDEPWFVAAVTISTMALAVYFVLQRWDIRAAHHARKRLRYDMEERTRRHWNQLYGLIDVSRMVGHRTDIHSIFEGITSTFVGSFDADAVSLMLYEKDTEELVVRAAAGPQARNDIVGRRSELGEGPAGWAARRREPVLLSSNSDASRYPGIELRDASINASMVVPIVVRGELVGVINVTSRHEDIRYNYEDLRTLEVFAENAGSCIRHVEQVTWLRTMVEQLRESAAQRMVTERSTT
jgi:transcriptional regulator with GAF, ATPase, and Fis domain